jgi:hypothetical protein
MPSRTRANRRGAATDRTHGARRVRRWARVRRGGDAERVASVRDSKDPDGPTLGFTPTAWTFFLDQVKEGRFDLA